jgi:hypothetical protein
MAYPLLRTGSLVISPTMMDLDSILEFPSGTTFSANTSDFNIATASANSDGEVTITPVGNVTGNVFVTLTATLPDNSGDITGTILVHVMDAPLSAKKFIVMEPQN